MATNNFYKIFIFLTFFCIINNALTMEVDLRNNEPMIISIDPGQQILLYHEITNKIAQYQNTEEQEIIKIIQNMFCHHHIKINQQDTMGNTLLYLAAGYNHKQFVSRFLAMGADQNIKNKLGLTPLIEAIDRRSVDCALELIGNSSASIPLTIIEEEYYNPEDPFCTFKNISPKNEKYSINYYPEYYLFHCKIASPENEPILENYKFIVPIHSALLCQRLIPLYQQQQNELLTLLTEHNHNHSLANDLLLKPKHTIIIKKGTQQLTVLEHSKLLGVLLLPLYNQEQRGAPLKLKYINHKLKHREQS